MRTSNNLFVDGNMFVNGISVYSINKLKHRFSYVEQDNILWEDFTPYEHLLTTAKLTGIPHPEKKVKEVINWFGLEKCQHTRVGNVLKRGLSGGEQKRTSIALEVLVDSSVIFLDEPTTGLDSKSALDVSGIIKMLSKGGRTIICTIHQPSSEIMARFDKVICLCEGNVVYDGPPEAIPQYFSEIGFPPPELTNPADHLMAIVNEDSVKIEALRQGENIERGEFFKIEVKEKFKNRLKKFIETYEEKSQKIPKEKCTEEEWNFLVKNPPKVKFCSVLCILLKRNLSYFFRNKKVFVTKVIQSLVFSLITIVLYNNMKSPKEETVGAIQDRTGMIFNTVSTIGFSGIFASLYGLIPLLPPFFREHEKRLYSPKLFYLISTLYHIPFQIFLCLLYQSTFYFIVDIKQGTEAFIKYYILYFSVYLSSSGFGDILSLKIRKVSLMIQFLPIVILPLFMFSGFLAVVKEMALPLVMISYLSYFKFAFQAGSYIEFDSETRDYYLLNCRIRKRDCFEDDNSCYIEYEGLKVCDPWENLNFIEKSYLTNILFLVGQAVVFRIISMVIFSRYTRDFRVKYRKIPKKETFVDPEEKEKLVGKKTVAKSTIFIHFLCLYLF